MVLLSVILRINMQPKILIFYQKIMKYQFLHERRPNPCSTQWYFCFTSILIQIKFIDQILGGRHRVRMNGLPIAIILII